MSERELIDRANRFCFDSQQPAGDLSHDQVHKLMADFAQTAVAEAIAAERERVREAIAKLEAQPPDRPLWVLSDLRLMLELEPNSPTSKDAGEAA